MAAARIPPIQCLLTFEALARLRSVTQTAEELCVTPSAVSHRVRQLEQIIGTKLFGRADFSLTTEGSEYLAHVREGLASLQKFPSSAAAPGKLKLKLGPVGIEQLLLSLVEETKALSQHYGLTISLELGEHLPNVNADAERVRQVMLNLINNACKYAAEGQKITIRAIKGPDLTVVIEVRDYGPGIPKDKQQQLFKPGYQLPGQNERSSGLGIGLALCKTLIELQGGKIWLESRSGKGSSFFFTLPALE